MKKIDKNEIPDDKSEIRLFAAIQNESLRIESLVSYYKELGVNRFFFVDNKSTDSTQEKLLSIDNVHVFYTEEKFEQKKKWKSDLLKKYGIGQWCIIVDADELLAYPHYETKKLKSLCEFMESENSNVLRGFLLDMYHPGLLSDSVLKEGENPLKVLTHFDAQLSGITFCKDYNANWKKNYVGDSPDLIHGGMRKRVIGHSALLNKVCLFKFDSSMDIMVGHHLIKGRSIRSSSIRALMMHTKYSSDFVDVVERESTRQIYWNGGAEYKMFKNAGVSNNPYFSFGSEFSTKFIDSNQLVNLGFMRDNPLFSYKLWTDLPKEIDHKDELKKTIFKNPEKLSIIIQTIQNKDIDYILDTSLNGGYNTCIFANNSKAKIYSIGENTNVDKIAKYALSKLENVTCELFESNYEGIMSVTEPIDFCWFDGINDYIEGCMALDKIARNIKKDGVILINNYQEGTIKDASLTINREYFCPIDFHMSPDYPILGLVKKDDREYIQNINWDEHKRKVKYINIGLSESGFEQVRSIFDFLGFKTDSYLSPEKIYMIDRCDYIEDVPMCNMFEKIDLEYNVKFIYNRMDIDTWLEKCKLHWSKHPKHTLPKFVNDYRQITYGTTDFDRDKFIEKYNEHDAKIKNYFQESPDSLLTINPNEKGLLKKIIEFIGIENIPD